MLEDDVLRIANSWWARDFACELRELRPETTRVQAHAGELSGNDGIWILVVGAGPLSSVPAEIPPEMERASRWTVSTVEHPAKLAEELAPTSAVEIIGPAYVGYATADSLKRPAAASARQLHKGDTTVITNLRAHCAAQEWEHGGSEFERVPTFGAFVGEGLAALAGYESWLDSIAHISVVTRHDHRGQGHGAAAVALAAEHSLSNGLLRQYRTLRSNRPSMRLAEKLGFESMGSRFT